MSELGDLQEAVAVYYLGPSALIGGSAYPASGYRTRVLMIVVVGGITGFSVQRLVEQVRLQAEELVRHTPPAQRGGRLLAQPPSPRRRPRALRRRGVRDPAVRVRHRAGDRDRRPLARHDAQRPDTLSGIALWDGEETAESLVPGDRAPGRCCSARWHGRVGVQAHRVLSDLVRGGQGNLDVDVLLLWRCRRPGVAVELFEPR